MLPPVNLTTLEHEKKQLKLDKLNHMFEKQHHRRPGSLERDESGQKDDMATAVAAAPKQQRTHRKYTTAGTKTTTPFVVLANSWTTPRGLNVSRILSSTLSWTSSSFDEHSIATAATSTAASAGEAVTGPNAAFVPSKSNSKPFMQTYKINQAKRLPNHFASLRLNYAGSGRIDGQTYMRLVIL